MVIKLELKMLKKGTGFSVFVGFPSFSFWIRYKSRTIPLMKQKNITLLRGCEGARGNIIPSIIPVHSYLHIYLGMMYFISKHSFRI